MIQHAALQALALTLLAMLPSGLMAQDDGASTEVEGAQQSLSVSDDPRVPIARTPEAIDAAFCYHADDLGVAVDLQSGSVVFKLWAPSAETVSLTLLDLEGGTKPILEPISMMRDAELGTWSITVDPVDLARETLTGLGYQYTVNGVNALDPYARSLATDDGEALIAAIIEPDTAAVPRFASITGYQQRTDAIIYALHPRDFTSDPELTATLGTTPFGTFDALQRRLDYLVQLGVTHINLAPVMASAGGNEPARDEREADWEPDSVHVWGQSPQAYFAPDGWYTSDPDHPQARVDELKQLIDAIHRRGMGVILDVVFSQSVDQPLFDAIEPGYFYRERNDAETLRLALATERCMVRKLVRDVLMYWTRTYGVDGFRFDRMGLMDARTMAEAHQAVAELNPNVLMFGEGERFDHGDRMMQAADFDWTLAQDRIAMMNTGFRNIVISGGAELAKPRFATGGAESVKSMFMQLQARPMEPMRTDQPVDLVQYLGDHRGLSLLDAIAMAINVDPDKQVAQAELHRRLRLVNTLLLSSQGAVMLDSGQEYGRSKRWRGETLPDSVESNGLGIHFLSNSDRAPDVANWFEWTAVQKPGLSAETARYTAGLIALRRATTAFRQGSREAVYRYVKLIETPDIQALDRAIAFEASNRNSSRLLVIVNADTRERRIRLTERTDSAVVLVDSKRAGLDPIASPVDVVLEARAVRLAPLTATVIGFPAR